MNYKHGSSHGRSRLYAVWISMKQRCHNPRNHAYMLYGGRGIEVCPQWRASFLAFASDIGPKPGPGYSIDRIDNDKGYSPENCGWATRAEQTANRRCITALTVDGVTKPIFVWAKERGITHNTLYGRAVLSGWKDNLFTPQRPRSANRITGAPTLTPSDIKPGHIYDGRRRRKITPAGTEYDDRTVTWVSETHVGFTSQSGSRYSKMGLERFVRWAYRDITALNRINPNGVGSVKAGVGAVQSFKK